MAPYQPPAAPERKTPETKAPEQRIRRLIGEQLFAVLSTVGRGQPYSSLVGFAASDDLLLIYFATGKATRKYANLKENPRSSVLIDDRGNLAGDIDRALALTAVGRVEEIGPALENGFKKAFSAKQPGLADFLYAPGTARLALKVEAYYLVSRFQNVVEYRPGA